MTGQVQSPALPTIHAPKINWGKVSVVVVAIMVSLVAFTPAYAIDLDNCFIPGAKLLVAGASPNDHVCFHSPPYTAVLWTPLLLLPALVSRLLVLTLSVAGMVYMLFRYDVPIMPAMLIFISKPWIHLITTGQYDVLFLFLVLMPSWSASMIGSMKPQASIGIVLYDVVKARTVRAKVLVLVPCGIFLAVITVLFPAWYTNLIQPVGAVWNTAIFPWGVPVFLALIFAALWRDERELALGASPFLANYVGWYTWILPLFALARYRVPFLVLWGGLWGATLL